MNAYTHQLSTEECEGFARLWTSLTGVGHITLTAIPAAGGATSTATFSPDKYDTMRRWIESSQAQTRNIYFQVNETMPGCRKKPGKGEMIAAVCRHADIDPVDDAFPWLEERDRLHSLAEFLHNDPTMPPTVLLDSGNGIYPLWVTERQLLAPGIDVKVEAENQEVEAAVGAGGTFNIDRLLRLPGTLNYPNAKKLKRGRGITRARLLHRSGKSYTTEQAAGLGAHLQALLNDCGLVRPHVAAEPKENTKKAAPGAKTSKKKSGFRDRSARAFGKGAELRRQGKTFEEMCEALRTDPETADWYAEKGEANDKRKLRRIWDRSVDDTDDKPARPVIQVVAGRLDSAATQGEACMLAAGLPIYQRGASLVRPTAREVPASRGRTTKAAGLSEQNAYAIIDHFCATAIWERFDARANEWVNTNPPMLAAQILLSRKGQWKFPSIAGVITCPTLRPDGSILIAPGYDAETRLYHIVDETLQLHPDLHFPTRERALSALNFLSALLTEFPFVASETNGETKQVSRAVALSALITPVVRGALSVAPLHAFRATTAGTGKSYLVDVVSSISSGRPCPVISAAPDDIVETEKRIVSQLLAGHPIISIDNVNGELGGDLLCQAIERPLIRIRPLGTSVDIEIENRASVLATGNQMRVVGDMVRRTVVADLDANVERPELREFKGNPVGTVVANRGYYVSAALMIVRAYIAAGKPGCLPALASFEDWSDLVRSALVWLGCDDPVLSMEQARDADPELGDLREALAAWATTLGCRDGFTASDIAKHAEERVPTIRGEPPDYAHPELREVMHRLAGVRGTIDTKRLGKWLLGREGRIVGNQKFIRRGKAHGGVVMWGVQITE